MSSLYTRLGRFVESRPATILGITIAVILVAAVGAAQTKIVTSEEVFADTSSQTYQDYSAYAATFGADPLVVMIPGTPQELTSPQMLAKIKTLNDVLAANPGVKSVVSPLTFLNAAPLPAGVSLDQPGVATSMVYGSDGKPNAALAGLFPTGYELVQISVQSSVGIDGQGKLADSVRADVVNAGLPTASVVAGYPRLYGEMVSTVTHDMAVTGIVAILLMIAVLYIVFPVRRRLLALPIVLIGVLITFGITGAAGVALTLVTMAGLPILLGLGMDFAIQFHNRYEEELARGDTPASGMVDALSHIGPTVGTAILATVLGFATLGISSIPAVRDFGALLALGVVVLYVVSLVVLNALLSRLDKGRAVRVASDSRTALEGSPAGSFARIKARLPRVDLGSRLAWISKMSVRFGPAVFALAVLAGLGGLGADHLVPVQTDLLKLIPSDAPAVVAMNQVRDVTGSSAYIQFLVQADDVTSPQVLGWMSQFQAREMKAHSQITSVNSLTTLMASASAATAASGSATAASGSAAASSPAAALAQVPAPILDSLISSDHKSASITFNFQPMSIDALSLLINSVQADAQPPAGVTVRAAGTPSIMASVIGAITDRRGQIAIAGFLAVFLGLLLVYRNLARAFVPVVPIALVTGWSSLAMYVFGIELNPLTAVMSALIVGIGTEFSVMLLGRYWEELGRGSAPREAMQEAVRRIGPAITASGLTVVAGFAALAASSFPAIREFGLVTVFDVLLCLGATLIVVPPLAVALVKRPQMSERGLASAIRARLSIG